MGSYIVKIGRSKPFGSRPLNILAPPDSAPFRGNAFLPRVAVMPLRQHSGEVARPVIPPGSSVREGQVIAVPRGENSAYVFSSVPGILREYRAALLPGNVEENAAVIELSGAFELSGRQPNPRDLESASPEWLLSMIENLGVLRTFDSKCEPLSFLLRSFRRELFGTDSAAGKGGPAGIVALRMHDYDPSCRVDSFLAETRAAAVLEGCALAAKSLDVRRVFLLCPNKKALAAASSAARDILGGFEVKGAVSSAVYPSGAEYFCKRAAARAFEGGRPESVFCINPWTAFSVFNALKFAMPVLHRPVLVAGSAIRAPQILNVRIGTRIRDVVSECGGFKFQPAKAVAGGLIAGKPLYDIDTPISAGTAALHFFGKRERLFFTPQRCIRCGSCLRICPMRLDPSGLALAAQGGRAADGAGKAGESCISCAACSAACPAGIPLHLIIGGSLDAAALSAAADGKGGQN